ncbi:MAG TPA: SDR family oxidoreductase [Candidatus Polarisedimenticolia bacterium]|nr:SDR family oxidoreductase [Candidatus Polarisedimenticolia bacterium]
MRVVITGASRGLGLEFTRRYLEAGEEVFALARAPERSRALMGMAGDRLVCVACDVGDEASIQTAFTEVAAKTDGIDLLLNNAATYGSHDDRLPTLKADEMLQVFMVNTLGPILMTREFLPLLREGKNPKVVHITSLMGSIEDNRGGGKYSYRVSKVGLNMASRNMALELAGDRIISVVIHPGWVRTEMGGMGAPLSIDEAVGSMIKTIAGLSQKHSGQFVDRHGKPAPW